MENIILLLIGAITIFLVGKIVRRSSKAGGCAGCSNCSSCSIDADNCHNPATPDRN